MREIKFRAWDKKRNIMVGSDYPQNWGNHQDEWYADTTMMDLVGIESISKSKRFYLMQYTGLKDRNGKEIYEEDVVRYTATVERNVFKVIFRNGRFIAWSSHIEHDLYFLTKNPGFEPNDCEVIGNVFESPDLLKDNS